MANYFIHDSSHLGDNTIIGCGTKIWHFCHIQSNSSIGENCTLGQNVYVGSNVKIGDNCKIQNNVSVYEGIELEDYVFCGPSCVFTNDLTPRCKYPKNNEIRPKTIVKYGASIGANATIVCGHVIGRHAMIGAGAVITKDVPDYALMLGVPARQAGWICECGEILPGYYQCNQCGRKYQISEGRLINETSNN